MSRPLSVKPAMCHTAIVIMFFRATAPQTLIFTATLGGWVGSTGAHWRSITHSPYSCSVCIVSISFRSVFHRGDSPCVCSFLEDPHYHPQLTRPPTCSSPCCKQMLQSGKKCGRGYK
ncbi:hypothetical protein AMECASPLE_024096, partial [Ameca splendens]